METEAPNMPSRVHMLLQCYIMTGEHICGVSVKWYVAVVTSLVAATEQT